QFEEGEVVPLTVISSEEELKDIVEKSDVIRLSFRTKLPRLIVSGFYYPLSKYLADVVFGQMQKYGPDFNQITQDQLRNEMFNASEGDIFREGTFSLSGREMPVICTDNEGETVDVTLLYDNKDYEKIIGLKDKYLRNPFKEFRDLICWSYVE